MCLAQQRKTEVDESSDESKRQKTEDAESPDAPSGEISVTENSGENKNKDELETKSEVNEIHSTPGNNTPDISSEDQVKSCVEEKVVEMERKEDDDSSENKENVIDETVSNVATEKTAELAEEEPAKVKVKQMPKFFIDVAATFRFSIFACVDPTKSYVDGSYVVVNFHTNNVE